MDTCPTVKVKADNDDGFMVINKSDYKEDEHELFKEPKAKPAAETEAAAKATGTAKAKP